MAIGSIIACSDDALFNEAVLTSTHTQSVFRAEIRKEHTFSSGNCLILQP